MPTSVLLSFSMLSDISGDSISAISECFLCKFSCVWIKMKWKNLFLFVQAEILFIGLRAKNTRTWVNNIHLLSLPLIQQPLGVLCDILEPWLHMISWLNHIGVRSLFMSTDDSLNGERMLTHCYFNISLPFEMSLWIIKMFLYNHSFAFQFVVKSQTDIFWELEWKNFTSNPMIERWR